ncbi:hypothetical protein [Nitrososphaera viennensis]|uniref:Uncharacterized protein n=1 Tax=Nitrososphaera viennensis TaxID=1034015 RepID=A0A977NNV0_9ARCH|nr:hypothetical protein [Nitrososphaera viennensis]UVS70100.1 hypothetical protein NWT39_04750 [Nitrososphaera viennensis]
MSINNNRTNENKKNATATEAVRIYKPTLLKEDPLPLDRAELSYAEKLLQASSNGLIPVKLEQDVVIQRISHDLYANAESGFRELYNNEARACRIARNHYDASPRIEVTLVPSERKLVIHGIDSTGMSQEKFLTVYTVLGRSDNFDSTEVGQFGMGRASYTCMSDIMVLETYSRETGEKYAVMGKNGIGYNVLPEPADLKEYGTRITLTVRQDIGILNLVKYMMKVCMFSGIDTYLNLKEDISTDGLPSYRTEKVHTKAGRYRLGTITFAEYLENKVQTTETYRPLVKMVFVESKDTDFYLYGIIAIRKGYDNDLVAEIPDSSSGETYLLGTPIEADGIQLPFSYWVLNVKDERKYPPTADRERLSDNAINAIEDKVKSSLKEKLQFLDLKSVQDYVESPYKPIYRVLEGMGLGEYLSEYTIDLCKFVEIAVKTPEYAGRAKIGDLLAQSQNLFYLDSLNENKIALIRSKVPDALVFRLGSKQEHESSSIDAFQLFRKFGVKFGEEFIRENNLKTKRRERIVPEDLPVHEAGAGWYSWGRFRTVKRHTTRTAREDVGSDTIRVPEGSMRKYLRLLSMVQTRYKVVRDDRELDSNGRGTALKSFVDGVGRKMVQTSDGKMRVTDTITRSNKKKVKLVLYSDPSITRYTHSEEHLSIAGDDDLLFELMAFYEFHGIEYAADMDGSEALALVAGHDFRRGEFIADPGYPKIGDVEILYSVVHAANAIKDEKMLNVFLNAVRYSKEATEVKEMREYLISKELGHR